MTTTSSAGAVVHDYMVRQVKALHRYRLPAQLAEDDAVHQMRVATRRLRSALSTYGLIYSNIPVSRQRLRWLAGVLGEVRDLEVLRTRFTSSVEELELEAPPDWLSELSARERTAYVELGQAFERPRFAELLASADRFAAEPDFAAVAVRPAAEVLAPIVAEAQRRLSVALGAVDAADDPAKARHEVRKLAKQVRYTADAAKPALEDEAESTSKRAKQLQTLLGHYQDCVVAIEYLEEHTAPDADGSIAVMSTEHRRQEEALAAVEDAREG